MAWRYVATKGILRSTGGAKKKTALEKRVKNLREDGWKVRLYEVK
jgi:hypothetical protein